MMSGIVVIVVFTRLLSKNQTAQLLSDGKQHWLEWHDYDDCYRTQATKASSMAALWLVMPLHRVDLPTGTHAYSWKLER